MISFVLHITSQVEHTKKCNSIDSESKSVKLNTNHQNHLRNSVFLHVTLVLPYGKKTIFGQNRVLWLKALTDQACVIVSNDWTTSATILLVLPANE